MRDAIESPSGRVYARVTYSRVPREVPGIRKVHAKYKDQGFVVVSISLDRNSSAFKSFVQRNKMRWRHVMDGT